MSNSLKIGVPDPEVNAMVDDAFEQNELLLTDKMVVCAVEAINPQLPGWEISIYPAKFVQKGNSKVGDLKNDMKTLNQFADFNLFSYRFDQPNKRIVISYSIDNDSDKTMDPAVIAILGKYPECVVCRMLPVSKKKEGLVKGVGISRESSVGMELDIVRAAREVAEIQEVVREHAVSVQPSEDKGVDDAPSVEVSDGYMEVDWSDLVDVEAVTPEETKGDSGVRLKVQADEKFVDKPRQSVIYTAAGEALNLELDFSDLGE